MGDEKLVQEGGRPWTEIDKNLPGKDCPVHLRVSQKVGFGVIDAHFRIRGKCFFCGPTKIDGRHRVTHWRLRA